jgi:NitT/TauT family transport system permease protein
MSAECDAPQRPRRSPAGRAAECALRDQQRIAAVRRRRRFVSALPWLIIIGFLLLWELFVRALGIAEFVLPAPTIIAMSMAKWWEPLLINAGVTLMTTSIGFALAIAVGLATGIAFGSSTLIYRGVYPLLIAFNSVPKVAVVPVLVLWFGVNAIPAIITAFVISVFPIVVNVATGIATIEPEQRDVLRALGARKRDIMLKVGLPRAMPYFFASLKIAITVAFVGSITAETVASESGIGHLMIVASSRFDVPLVFAGLIVTGIMGVGMYAIAAVIETHTTKWATRGQGDF